MSKTTNSLDASRPEQNATVHASAGTGKTWLLITRLTRMLLSDVEPGNIVALTFTRKAASEMLSRLHERIESLATNNRKQLDEVLIQSGIDPTPAIRLKAQQQFEKLLHAEYPVRISTFHSFCQDLLLRFPLEAEVPPAFDLLNSASTIQEEAWEALYQQAESDSGSNINEALKKLFAYCKGLSATNSLLDEFINARIDWWAWTHDKQDPVQFACDNLSRELELESLESTDVSTVLDKLFSKEFCHSLQSLAVMLSAHDTKTNLSHASLLLQALDNKRPSQQRYDYIRSALIVKSTGLARKPSKALLSKLDAEQAALMPDLYAQVADRITILYDLLQRLHAWHLSCAWFTAGHALIVKFQEIKRQRRLLDFSDLEWKTYQLLNHGDNALWVQYKLDQRIDHLLIDEFQDTSPSQWHMILPVLQEFASSENERHRSIFIVGDEKQSIYQFRRANPELLEIAANWLQDNLHSDAFHMDMSRRSSPAVIEVVNAVFGPAVNSEGNAETSSLIPSWQTHHSFHSDLWGAVTVLPLVCLEKEEENTEMQVFRNPLNEPLSSGNKLRHAVEADQIAEKILELISSQQVIKVNGQTRLIEYSDVMILIPRRTHAGDIEDALTENSIPFIGAERGTLLQCLEIQDLCALLKILLTPYDNLALAQVLRSPLYHVTENDLLYLAAPIEGNKKLSWFEKLRWFKQENLLEADSPLLKALQQITHWREWAGILPVHDLLDRIYHESDLIDSYITAYPESLRPRIHANFSRFIDIALDLDSGRYPGLTRFLDHIQNLRNDADAPSTPAAAGADNRVKIITIHSAKGLEAPVVFLANATKSRSRSSGYTAIMDWPTESKRPSELFIIQNTSADAAIIKRKLERRDALYEQEKNNLLYVAMTRACQYLFISGSIQAIKDPKKLQESLGWYGLIREAIEVLLANDSAAETSQAITYQYGTAETYVAPPHRSESESESEPAPDRKRNKSATDAHADPGQINLDLGNNIDQQAMPLNKVDVVSPSQSNKRNPANIILSDNPIDSANQELEQLQEQDQQCRGVTLHRILELACRQLDVGETPIWPQIIFSMSNDKRYLQAKDSLQECLLEVKAVLNSPELNGFFTPDHYQQMWNEIPICYSTNTGIINGLIDRLLLTDNEAIIIDYKSHRIAEEQKDIIANTFRPQMDSYKKGIQKIWPDKKVRCLILFTSLAKIVEL